MLAKDCLSVISVQRVTSNTPHWSVRRRCKFHLKLRCSAEQHKPTTRPTEYTGSDGRRKATIEEAFSTGSGDSSNTQSTDGRQPPWGISWQTAERSIEWNDDIKHRLVKRVTAEKLGVPEQDVAQKLEALQRLLQLSADKMTLMGPDMLAQLADDPIKMAQKLVTLKEIFPDARTTSMVANDLSLVLKADLVKVAASAKELRSMLPGVDVDRLVEMFPRALDVDSLKKTMQHAQDIMPGLDTTEALNTRPGFIFQFQRGKDLIPYDEVPTQQP